MQTNVESATLDSVEDAVTIQLLDGADTAVFELASGLTGTVTFEVQTPSTWRALSVTPVGGGAAVTTATAAGAWAANVAGWPAVRMRVSAFTSGSATGYAATGF